ncbi:vancomycin resistance protein VanW [Elusimicrobium posterum]|uniref:VanW family protein n=1 Tax=Elusimicrobium posterum TaxID=3116653 RepID=UPI003C786DAC
MKKRKLLSQYHPALYFLAVWLRRIRRYGQWCFDSKKYAKERNFDNFPFRVKKHQSVLLRKLCGDEMQLQINKVTNLRVALKNLDGIVIKPGETFSFCKIVGLPSKRKGYLPGMELSFGKARAGTGGGLCQISNLLHWMALHSPLTITERYHHSFDPFPDEGRVLPFGSGATVFYNYRDFQFTNNTQNTFQIRLWISDKCLEGDLRCLEEPLHSYHVFERDHKFLKIEEEYYRKNTIWRERILKANGTKSEPELVVKNFARVMYKPEVYEEAAEKPAD